MEIVRIAGENYKRYEELLLRRDALQKEAEEYGLEYIRQFGGLITAVFQAQIDCIAMKKAVSFCQAARNRGEKPDYAALEAHLAVHMAAYNEELQEMLRKQKFAESGTPVSVADAEQCKRIYRRIAKLLHPDLSPLTREHPELLELFRRAVAAYKCNSLKKLQELEVLVRLSLEQLGAEQTPMIIEDVDAKIEALEKEMYLILTTEPYTYRNLLTDLNAMEEKRNALCAELESFENYKQQLETLLGQLKG